MKSRILKITIGRPKRFAVLLILLLCSLNAVATQQLMERLEYGGQEYFIGIECKGLSRPLWYFPLNSYLKQEKINLIKRLQFYKKEMTSACWRCYVGYWSIRDDKFFLLRLDHDTYTLREKAKTYPLSVVNSDWKSPVFANWYTGSFWLCKCIAYEFYYLVPVYQVEIKQGKVLKVADFPHWLRDAAMKSEKMKKQLAVYREQNLKPYQAWDESLCQNFFRCIRRVKPGMTLAEVEENMKMFDPDGENFKAAKAMKVADSGADAVLRFYVFKLKKNAASKDDISLDLQFHTGKLKELRIGLNDKQKSESANKRQNAGNRRKIGFILPRRVLAIFHNCCSTVIKLNS